MSSNPSLAAAEKASKNYENRQSALENLLRDKTDELNGVKRLLNDAMEKDRKGSKEDALELYEKGLSQMMDLMKKEKRKDEKEWLESNIRRHLERAEYLKESIAEDKRNANPDHFLLGETAYNHNDMLTAEKHYSIYLSQLSPLMISTSAPSGSAFADPLGHSVEEINRRKAIILERTEFFKMSRGKKRERKKNESELFGSYIYKYNFKHLIVSFFPVFSLLSR